MADSSLIQTPGTPEADVVRQHIILFYRYHPLTSDTNQIEAYRSALERLCTQLGLCGRILVGASKTEGINGTLAGQQQDHVRAFTWALLGDETSLRQHSDDDAFTVIRQAVQTFWEESAAFFKAIGEDELRIQSPDDFKWSVHQGTDPLFPDLRIVVRKELIGSGSSVMADISLQETATGYLTPEQWHDRLATKANDDNTVIIDCRNTKEYEIGRFEGALDPSTTTFSQFPHWVQHNKALLANKEVLMYCTGGIRCEKASAYIRRTVPQVRQVNHLKGGIHKYLETYGGRSDSLWHGKNFVFDGRQAVSAEETHLGKDGGTEKSALDAPSRQEIMGKCVYCDSPYDQFEAKCVCAVCREPLLACTNCQNRPEYHCRQHLHLKNCYFVQLERFSRQELMEQKQALETYLSEIAVGRKFKQKRKTLVKQCQRISERLQEMPDNDDAENTATPAITKCRNCGQADCTGKCWGFFGLKRKEVLETTKKESEMHGSNLSAEWSDLVKKPKRQRQKDKEEPEIERLGLFCPCSTYRDSESGIRVPPCVTRTLRCHTKGKWCGRTVVEVVQEEFKELESLERLQESLRHGLLRLNGKPLDAISIAQTKLKSADVLSRVLHWHEAPVIVPARIGVEKTRLPDTVLDLFNIDPDEAYVYVCDKPSSVPVHLAGPFFANVLTSMVEAQLNLPPQALNPVHRTDRVTSGLTLCCTDPKVARVFHKCLSEGTVRKMYIAKVKGRFPANENELVTPKKGVVWANEESSVEVNARVFTSDPANGIRVISDEGKESQSRFKLVHYDDVSNTSIIKCFPVTGRNHQLRLHLSYLGFPILHDVQYGGMTATSSSADKSLEAIESMRQAIQSDKSDTRTGARKACPVCNDEENGLRNSFTRAHLLKEGHSIMLHAFRYEVSFTKQQKEIAFSTYNVGLPDWVTPELMDQFK